MRSIRAFAAIALAACGVSNPTAITITTDIAPGLVAFREGATGPWQAATLKTATRFEADVHGPYVVAVQCVDLAGFFFQTTEFAQTPDDPHDLMVTCDSFMPAPMPWSVTGQMVQAGQVWFAVRTDFGITSEDMGTAPNWSYNIPSRTGTSDLMAVTPTAIAFRRAISVSSDLVVTPPIDLTQEGAPLVATAFSVTNPAPGETLAARVYLDNGTLIGADIYRGAPATAMVAPDSQLLATDNQRATIYATAGAQTRSLSQPFRAGAPAACTLPPPSTLVLALESGQLVASWNSLLPDFDTFDVEAIAFSSASVIFDLEMTPAFEAATHATQLVLDTNLPGYNAAQGIDFFGSYQQFTTVQRVANDVVETTSSDQMFGPSVTTRAAGRTARLRARRP